MDETPRNWTGRAASFLLGVAATLMVMLLGTVSVVEFGLYNPTAASQHGHLATWLLHDTFLHAIGRMTRGQPQPDRFSLAQVEAGARLYKQRCAMCHGGPGASRADWTVGMTPSPPFLLDRARRRTPAELHLIVADGVKMTAMPAWRYLLSDDQVWDLVAFLEAMPTMTPAAYRNLTRTAPNGVD